MAAEPILIVDDNLMNLKLARVLLEGEGHEVRTAVDSEQAWAVLKDFHPRLILMDIQLPGMDGLELTRLLKADPATRDTVVVALTAYAMKGDEEIARSAGCDGYITKPIDTRTFPGQVQQYLAPQAAPKPVVDSGDYQDLLTELRNNFLAEGQEESRRLIDSLDSHFDVSSARRISHRWAGIAGTLGFPQISHTALDTETLLEKSMVEIAGELRTKLEELAQLFADGVRGKLELPVFSAEKDLSGKRFALIGFEQAEASRIARALEASQAFTRAMPAAEAAPGSQVLLPFDLVIVSVSAQNVRSAWTQLDALASNTKPLLFVGSREMLLELTTAVQERAQDFLIAPWDPEEVVLRTCRILAKNAKQAETRPQLDARPAAANRPQLGPGEKPRVVIADDDPTITALVSASLQKFGVDSYVAREGAEALELTKKLLPNALILDVLMPQYDGFEVLSRLKRDPQTSGVPVIMLTVRQQASDVMRGFGFGAEDYVVKPFNPMELAARVMRLLPGNRESRSMVA